MNITRELQALANWTTKDLHADKGWVFPLTEKESRHLRDITLAAFDPNRDLFEYSLSEFELGPAEATLKKAIKQAHHGRGVALVKNLPRQDMNEDQFKLLNWAIGLHIGVARPQGKASQYISPVRDAGVDYRAASGRGYSSNAKLDFHVDGADMATLGCYNAAKLGGSTMFTSGVSAFAALEAERPDLAELAKTDFYFSRQNEEAEDEGPYYGQPLIDFCDGRLFAKWNRNRVQSAQRFDSVPRLSALQHETMDVMDNILRRPEYMLTLNLQPGDLQIFNNHCMLHSRTDYEDFAEPEKKRLLWRLWIAPPDSPELPESWGDFYRSTVPGTVRGGIRGHNHGIKEQDFDARHAAALGMPTPKGV